MNEHERVVPLDDRAADRYIVYHLGEPVLTVDLLDSKSILRGIAFLEMALFMEKNSAAKNKLRRAQIDLHIRYESLQSVNREKES